MNDKDGEEESPAGEIAGAALEEMAELSAPVAPAAGIQIEV